MQGKSQTSLYEANPLLPTLDTIMVYTIALLCKERYGRQEVEEKIWKMMRERHVTKPTANFYIRRELANESEQKAYALKSSLINQKSERRPERKYIQVTQRAS